jgi:hypothetical protein
MKSNNYKWFFSGIIALFFITSCDFDELRTFTNNPNNPNSDNRIYFTFVSPLPGPMGSITSEQRADSLVANFAAYRGQESIRLGVQISVMGVVEDFDRPVLYEMTSTSTAEEGVDVILLPAMFRAGRSFDTLWVQANKTERLLEETVRVNIRLIENEYFKTDFARDTIFTFIIENEINIPLIWALSPVNFERNFGPFTKAKYNLMMELGGFDDAFLNDIQPGETAAQAIARLGLNDFLALLARQMRRHLQELRDAGTPLLDEFGNPVTIPGTQV